LCAPSSDDLVHNPRNIPGHLVALTNWKLPDAARMKRIGNVIATVLVVTLNSKSGQQRRTLKIAFSDSQGIAVVGLALRSSVVHKHVQAVAEYMFVGHLRSVVVSVAVSRS